MEKYTSDQLQEWKAKYGEENIRESVVTVKEAEYDNTGKLIAPEETETFVLRVPGRKEIEAVGQHGMDKNVSKANAVLISNCVLHGNLELIERDGSVYAAVLSDISVLVAKKKSTLKNL